MAMALTASVKPDRVSVGPGGSAEVEVTIRNAGRQVGFDNS
jgi:hypothetical protein